MKRIRFVLRFCQLCNVKDMKKEQALIGLLLFCVHIYSSSKCRLICILSFRRDDFWNF